MSTREFRVGDTVIELTPKIIFLPAKVRVRATRLPREAIPFDVDRDHAYGWPCPYCWTVMTRNVRELHPTWDHVIPKGKGGTDARANLLPVCWTCNQAKRDRTLPEFHGWLKELCDYRTRTTGQLIEWLTEEWDSDLKSGVHADIGVGVAAARREIRQGIVKRPLTVLQHKQTTAHNKSVEQLIWDVMLLLGIPRTHWTYLAPRGVRVLLGSLPETFQFESAVGLSSAIKAHPRAKFVPGVRP